MILHEYNKLLINSASTVFSLKCALLLVKMFLIQNNFILPKIQKKFYNKNNTEILIILNDILSVHDL